MNKVKTYKIGELYQNKKYVPVIKITRKWWWPAFSRTMAQCKFKTITSLLL